MTSWLNQRAHHVQPWSFFTIPAFLERHSDEELVLQQSIHRAFIMLTMSQFDHKHECGSLAAQPRLDWQSNLPQG
jgi:hypothetical protein